MLAAWPARKKTPAAGFISFPAELLSPERRFSPLAAPDNLF
jgi:hypothetical protein